MYYFKYEMKIQLIPYIELDVKNFLDAFRRVLNNPQMKQKYFRNMKKKIKQTQDFYDNNFTDFRVHMILRSRKLLLDFWKQNTHEFEQINKQMLHHKSQIVDHKLHKRGQNYVDTVSIKSDHLFNSQINISNQSDAKIRNSEIISLSHNPSIKQVKKPIEKIQIITQNNPFKKTSKYVISAREDSRKQQKIKKSSSKKSLNQGQSIYGSGTSRIALANNKYSSKKHIRTQVSDNLQSSKEKKLNPNRSQKNSQQSKNGWHQIKKNYVKQQPIKNTNSKVKQIRQPVNKEGNLKSLSKQGTKQIKKIQQPVNKKMTKQQYIKYLKNKKN